MFLDLNTLTVMGSAVSGVSCLVMLLIWRIDRHLPGVLYWMLAILMIGLSYFALFSPDLFQLSERYAAFFSDAFGLIAVVLLLEGCLQFRGYYAKRRWQVELALIPLVLLIAWFNSDDPQARYLFHDAFIGLGLLAVPVIMNWSVSEPRERLAYSLVAVSGVMMAAAFLSRWTIVFTDMVSGQSVISLSINSYLFFALTLFNITWTYGVAVACYYRTREALYQQAREDPLTGLPNRRSIQEVLTRTLEEAQRNGRQWGVIIIDVNEFKTLNDRKGHSIGDGVLVAIAERLRNCIRGADFTARLSGDEFMIVAHDMEEEQSRKALMDRVRKNLNGSFTLRDGSQFEVTVSIGMAIYPQDGDTADRLLAVADHRMYREKTAR